MSKNHIVLNHSTWDRGLMQNLLQAGILPLNVIQTTTKEVTSKNFSCFREKMLFTVDITSSDYKPVRSHPSFYAEGLSLHDLLPR